MSRKTKKQALSSKLAEEGDAAAVFDNLANVTISDDEEDYVVSSGESDSEGEASISQSDSGEEPYDSDAIDGSSSDEDDEEGDFTPKGIIPDSDSDSSEDESIVNRVGQIPLEWYKEYEHIGYDKEGNKIMKKKGGDTIQQLLRSVDDKNFLRTVYDELHDKEHVLTDEELEVILRIQQAKFPQKDFDPYPRFEDFVDYPDGKIHPMTNAPTPKSAFLPSKDEAKKVYRLFKAIKNGSLKLSEVVKSKKKSKLSLIWDDDTNAKRGSGSGVNAPKIELPGHEHSYNPPDEYLPTQKQIEHYHKLDPALQRKSFLPQKYKSLRHVPAYNYFIHDRFERCLDLYLCPRTTKRKVKHNVEKMLPALPNPQELKPFPTTATVTFTGHTGKVRCMSIDCTGQWLVTGSDDRTIKLFEVETGRCFHTWNVGGVVECVQFNPNPDINLIAAAVDFTLIFIHPVMIKDENVNENTKTLLASRELGKISANKRGRQIVEWRFTENGQKEVEIECDNEDVEDEDEDVKKDNAEEEEKKPKKYVKISVENIPIRIEHNHRIKQVAWHLKGDYFTTVCPKGQSKSVLVHQLSKRSTQSPFGGSKGGSIQRVQFHPTKPFFFICTQRYVRVYNLAKQELAKKVKSTSQWISSLAVHPSGNHLLAGGYDRKLCWFDLDMDNKPFKTLRFHSKAVRQVAFHERYPLFASCSDDLSVHVFHGMVHEADLFQDPLIVPLKILKDAHALTDHLGVLDCQFHPVQPWLFTAGADSKVILWT